MYKIKISSVDLVSSTRLTLIIHRREKCIFIIHLKVMMSFDTKKKKKRFYAEFSDNDACPDF